MKKLILGSVLALSASFSFAGGDDLYMTKGGYMDHLSFRAMAGLAAKSKAVHTSSCENSSSGTAPTFTLTSECSQYTSSNEKGSAFDNQGLSFAGSFSVGLFEWELSNRFRTEVAFWAFSDFTQNLTNLNLEQTGTSSSKWDTRDNSSTVDRNAVLGRLGLEVALSTNDGSVLASLGLHNAVVSVLNSKYLSRVTSSGDTANVTTPGVQSSKKWKNHLGVNGSVYLTPFKCKDHSCSFGVGVTGGCSRGDGAKTTLTVVDQVSTPNATTSAISVKDRFAACEGMLGFAVTTS